MTWAPSLLKTLPPNLFAWVNVSLTSSDTSPHVAWKSDLRSTYSKSEPSSGPRAYQVSPHLVLQQPLAWLMSCFHPHLTGGVSKAFSTQVGQECYHSRKEVQACCLQSARLKTRLGVLSLGTSGTRMGSLFVVGTGLCLVGCLATFLGPSTRCQ